MLKIIHNKYFYVGFFFLLILVLTFFVLPNFLPVIFVSGPRIDLASVASTSSTTIPEIPFAIKKVITHIKTPEAVKGIYMTACVAGTPSFRAKLVKLINETELNSVIIDIKDYTGTISFKIDSSEFKDNTGGGCKVSDMVDFIETLHQNNIYVISVPDRGISLYELMNELVKTDIKFNYVLNLDGGPSTGIYANWERDGVAENSLTKIANIIKFSQN